MQLYFVRHGDPIYEPDSLTPLGHRQAEAIGKRLASEGIDEIYASTSVRATLTATPCAELCKKDIIPLAWCHEHLAGEDFDVYTEDGGRDWIFHVLKYKKAFHSSEVRNLGDKWYTHPLFADTNCERGVKRIEKEGDAFMSSLGYERDAANHCFRAIHPTDKHIALFAHGGFGRIFLSYIMQIPYPYFENFQHHVTGLTVFSFQPENGTDIVFPQMLTYSNDGHGYAERIPIGH